MNTRRRTSTALAIAAVLCLCLGPAATAVESPDELPDPTPSQLAASVRRWDQSNSVRSFESVESSGGKTTIVLSTDILFDAQSYDLPSSAAPRIAALLSDVPDGAAVRVTGHTDSLVGPIPNDELSENRARAVAEVIAAERPDLELDVAGLADTEPAVAENPSDASTYAANRRVEITQS